MGRGVGIETCCVGCRELEVDGLGRAAAITHVARCMGPRVAGRGGAFEAFVGQVRRNRGGLELA